MNAALSFVREGDQIRWTMDTGATGLLNQADMRKLAEHLNAKDDHKSKALAAKLTPLLNAEDSA